MIPCLERWHRSFFQNPAVFQSCRHTTAAVCGWEKEWRRALLPSAPLASPPSLDWFSSLVHHLDSFSSRVMPQVISLPISQFTRISPWKKCMGLILGNGMWFLWGSIWPQVSRSTEVVPLPWDLWASPGHSLAPPALSQRTSVWVTSQPGILVFTKSYKEANRIQLKISYVPVTRKLF